MHKRGNLTWKDIKWLTIIKLSTSGAHNKLLYIGTEYHRKSSTAINCKDYSKYSGGQVKSQEGDIYLSFLLTRTSILCQNPSCFYKITGVKIVQLLKLTYLSDTMFPSSAGKLRILLEDRSRYTRLWSLAMSEGIRDKELSLRCKAVKWVSVHNDELKLLTFPVEGRWRKKIKIH